MKKRERKETYDTCGDPHRHREHMCLLMESGRTAEVALKSSSPAFACKNCRAVANDAEDLCNPTPLEK